MRQETSNINESTNGVRKPISTGKWRCKENTI